MTPSPYTLSLPRTDDFEVTALTGRPPWQGVSWQPMMELTKGGEGYDTRFKACWSTSGIYVLLDCQDKILSCSSLSDFDDLYREDIVEFFLWPDPARPLYFEYEISPLGKELVLLVPNLDGEFMGWRPWHYEGNRLVRRAVRVHGGDPLPGARVEGWTAEFFVPFTLLQGVAACPPACGTEWRANVYRMDYDKEPRRQWAWSPVKDGQFHRYHEFGAVRFE